MGWSSRFLKLSDCRNRFFYDGLHPNNECKPNQKPDKVSGYRNCSDENPPEYSGANRVSISFRLGAIAFQLK